MYVDGGGKGGYLLGSREGEGTGAGSCGPFLASPLMLVARSAHSVHPC